MLSDNGGGGRARGKKWVRDGWGGRPQTFQLLYFPWGFKERSSTTETSTVVCATEGGGEANDDNS